MEDNNMERNAARYNSQNNRDNKNNMGNMCDRDNMEGIKAADSRRLEARRKAKLIRCRQLAVIKCFIASLIMIIIVGVSSILVVNASNKTEEKKCTRYYTSVCIDSNDTLWSIAKEYRPDNCDISTYISDIKAINHMTSDTIYAGQNIIVYYCEFED